MSIQSSKLSQQCAQLLEKEGYASARVHGNNKFRTDVPNWQARMHPDISHRYVAVASGLGSFGWSGNVGIEGYGTAIILGTVVTTADLALTFEGRDKASSFTTGSMGGDPSFGCEAWFHTMFAARIGWQESGVTGGAGFRLGGLGVDYAFVPHDDLGSSHRVSASYLF